MRLLGRCLWVLGLAAGCAVAAAVVMPIGCGVDQEPHLPGLPDALPNRPGGAGFVAGAGVDGGGNGGGGFGGSGVGGTGGSVVVGPAETICDVAASANVSGSLCATCVGDSAGVTGPNGCGTEDMACTNDVLCKTALACMATCKPGAGLDACVVMCVGQSPVYQAFLACAFDLCGVDCGQPVPLACNINDGG